MAKPKLTIRLLLERALQFSSEESRIEESSIYGITDGKAIGTYFEHKFRTVLKQEYEFKEGSSALGIDFPELELDMKVTSIKQPQSSCPYKSSRQKVFGLGYGLLIFVYEKKDNARKQTGRLIVRHTIYVEKHRTADYQMTKELRKILKNKGNKDDIIGCLFDKNLPVEEIEANRLADEILENRPVQGYLTISNALQWRLQYRRVIDNANEFWVENLLPKRESPVGHQQMVRDGIWRIYDG